MTQKPIFRTIESKNVSYFRLWYSSSIISILFLGISLLFIMDFIVSLSGNKVILYGIISISILNTIICEGKIYSIKKSKKAYNKVVINSEGIIFNNTYNLEIVAKIPWTAIQKRRDEKFDVDFLFRARNKSYNVYLFWSLTKSLDSKIPQWSANKFAIMFAKFSNKGALLTAFFSGIAQFRPDITVNPIVYNFYRLNPNTFELDKAGIKKENFTMFLIIIAIIILCLLASFLIIIFSRP